jgi:NTE family protein
MMEPSDRAAAKGARDMPEGKALVLGGGGVAGIAWMTGLLTGLAEAGADLTAADLIIGTSAGANVAAQVGSGLPLPDLYARQADPQRQAREIAADLDLERLGADFVAVMGEAESAREIQRRMGAYALAADTVPEADRRAVIEGRLPSHEWPERAIRLVAVEAVTGETAVFDRGSAVSLVDAVAASSAVPGVWPPVTIGEKRYMDGGVGSTVNVALAADCDTEVVLVPQGESTPSPFTSGTADEIRAFAGSAFPVFADDDSLAAFGANPLDPACRKPSALAGREQGRRVAAAVADFLG